MNDEATVLTPHPAIATVFLDGQAVLYDERTGGLTELNPAASALWIMADGSSSMGEIVAELADVFGAPADVVRVDALAALDGFDESSLLLGSPEPLVEERPSDRASGREILLLTRPPDP